tara:strand:- start:41 stop:232 length:192 start_codon:yes stop_codon:yes gene_type:complete
MSILYDFICVNKHTEELFANPDSKEAICSVCGEPSKRLISPVRLKLSIHTNRWAKEHEKAAQV